MNFRLKYTGIHSFLKLIVTNTFTFYAYRITAAHAK